MRWRPPPPGKPLLPARSAPGATPPAPGATPPAPGATPPAPGATPPAPGATPPAPGATPPAPGTPPPATTPPSPGTPSPATTTPPDPTEASAMTDPTTAQDAAAVAWPDEADPTLLDAFWQYERALMQNSVPQLDRLFAGGGSTIRSDGGSTLVGHDAIAAFRASRPAPPQRYLRRVHVRPITSDSAVIVAESVRDDGGTGVQTQLWQRDGEQSPWAVAVAHVSTVPGATAPPAEGANLTPEHERAIWATPAARRPLLPAAPATTPAADLTTSPDLVTAPALNTSTAPAPATTSGPPAPPPTEHPPLAGIRVAVKDLFAIAGETIGAGNPRFAAGRTPEASTAPAVQALIDAGAEITGLAQTDELAFSIAGTNVHYGTPPNPAAPGRISGGSTSGPAAAVALGLADLALGTDTAGSIRVPGSYQGQYGLRTTHDAVSREGLVPLAPSFDTVGVLARDLPTLAAGARAILATGIQAPDAAAEPVTHLLVDPTLVTLADPAVQLTFTAALRALALNAGLAVRVADASTALVPADLERWFTAFRIAQQYEAWQGNRDFVTANPGALDPAIAERFRVASTITEAEIAEARATLAEATVALETLVRPGTALALPSTSSAAPLLTASAEEIDRVRGATLRLTCLSSLSGLPALTLPYGSVCQLPVGLCVIGARHADLALLALAAPRH